MKLQVVIKASNVQEALSSGEASKLRPMQS